MTGSIALLAAIYNLLGESARASLARNFSDRTRLVCPPICCCGEHHRCFVHLQNDSLDRVQTDGCLETVRRRPSDHHGCHSCGYNEGPMVQKSISSAIKAPPCISLSVICVDDGSQDDTYNFMLGQSTCLLSPHSLSLKSNERRHAHLLGCSRQRESSYLVPTAFFPPDPEPPYRS